MLFRCGAEKEKRSFSLSLLLSRRTHQAGAATLPRSWRRKGEKAPRGEATARAERLRERASERGSDGRRSFVEFFLFSLSTAAFAFFSPRLPLSPPSLLPSALLAALPLSLPPSLSRKCCASPYPLSMQGHRRVPAAATESSPLPPPLPPLALRSAAPLLQSSPRDASRGTFCIFFRPDSYLVRSIP